jgi:FkbM family methyltransferase
MMAQAIKNMVRNSALYRAYRQYGLIRELRDWSIHDLKMLEFYSGFVSPGALCFDVGANIGNRVKIFLELQAEVVAIEPQEKCAQILKRVFGHHQHLRIIQKALGEREGEAEIMISDSDTLSSMSPEWIEAVKKSGRFAEYRWDNTQKIQMTTLDNLIQQYGIPQFIKIDVEGFENQVIRGLSQPVPLISLEFVSERIKPTLNCIDHLAVLGDIRLNYSMGESMEFSLETWIGPEEMKSLLSSLAGEKNVFGDVYIKSEMGEYRKFS